MKKLLLLAPIIVLSGLIQLSAQQTVGLFINSFDAYDGYTLFAPIGAKRTYLINNCGEEVHRWNSAYTPGLAVYFLENGNLLRTGLDPNVSFNGGGTGGIIEIIDWNDNVLWTYIISSGVECQHHDIGYLPNGNILAVVWDLKTQAEASLAGRVTFGTSLWSEKIVEIEPDLINGTGTVVWEWKAWDHLVQDVDSTRENYGIVADSPGLININFYLNDPTKKDWLHFNSVDYNAKLDQIVISNHNFNEIWIIDHSTTITEAASSEGGSCGVGGDLLYRWGNPQSYNKGTAADRKLFLQHNAYWIDSAYVDGGMIMIFNNRAGTPVNYSTVNIIDPPLDSLGNYTYTGSAYAPSVFHWTYTAPIPTDFYGANISGAQRLPNGNTLICAGPSGRFFEVDYTGEELWRYVNPVTPTGALVQGSPASANRSFRAERYAKDYPGFDDNTPVSVGYIETGSTFPCETYNSVEDKAPNAWSLVYPNPANSEITVSTDYIITSVSIYNLTGVKMLEYRPNSQIRTVNIEHLAAGLYFVKVLSAKGQLESHKIVIKK